MGACDDGMREFMEEKGCKEQHARREGPQRNSKVTPLGVAGVEMGRERHHDEQCNQKPAVVQPYFDSEKSTEPDLRFQVKHLSAKGTVCERNRRLALTNIL